MISAAPISARVWAARADAEEFERKKVDGGGADSLTVLEDIIAREKIECGCTRTPLVGA
jgi:hypothetical protein